MREKPGNSMKAESNIREPRIAPRRSGIGIFILLAIVSLVPISCNNNTSEHHDTYTCPMHPTVTADRPGTCPVCGMDLVRKARPGEEVTITEDLARLMRSPSRNVVSSIKTIKGQYKEAPLAITAQGIVTYDTRNVYSIVSRIGGRLDKVYFKFPFQKITKGQKLAEIYSPELLTAERELLFLLENDSQNHVLIQSAKDKLSYLGLSESQISALLKRKTPDATLTIYSPHNGYLVAEDQLIPQAPLSAVPASPSAAPEMEGGMSGRASNVKRDAPMANGDQGSVLRNGSYVSAGQILLSVIDFSSLRIELKIPARQTASLTIGTPVQVDLGNGSIRAGKVDFLQPFFSNGDQFSTVRINTDQTDLHIGHLVNATINIKSVEGLWVPSEAVVDLGMEKVVFVKDRNGFKSRRVVTGASADQSVEIKSGLSSSDEIAANAQFLVDSESSIKTGN